MIIDFHTHIFPENIAQRTISKLENSGGIKASSNGTLDGLLQSMKASGIDISVVLPVATSPGQFDSINKYAAGINGEKGIISFGGIHPENEEPEKKIDYIKALGLPGIKLHPDFQGTFIDDERYIRIIRHAVSIGLYVTIHCGCDVSFPELVHATPERIVNMLSKVYPEKEPAEPHIILAHLGSTNETQKVYDTIAQRTVYLDTAVMLDIISAEQLIKLIRKHGSDKILFATDSPWAPQKKYVDIMMNLKISAQERNNILYQNALKILKNQNIGL